MPSVKEELAALLAPHGQEQLLTFWDELAPENQRAFADEIREVTYKKRKMEIKRRILVALHLVDEK